MKRINSLIAPGVITNRENFKMVDTQAVEPTTPAGCFHYFIERHSVFKDTRGKAGSKP